MSSGVSESEVYETSVVGPDDGDARNAASVRTGLQDLANRTKWLDALGLHWAIVTTPGTVDASSNKHDGSTPYVASVTGATNATFSVAFTTAQAAATFGALAIQLDGSSAGVSHGAIAAHTRTRAGCSFSAYKPNTSTWQADTTDFTSTARTFLVVFLGVDSQ